jgi:glycosyltransferase involved in cell wall biosynthesis
LHWQRLALAAKEQGFDVMVATRVAKHAKQIVASGLKLVPLGLSRRSQNPVREAASLAEIVRVYRSVRPHIVHHVAMKPALYGSLAARLARVPAVVNALTGLGYVFSSKDLKARLLRPIIEVGYRFLLDTRNSRVVVQNPDDLAMLTRRGLVHASRMVVVRGSGVDLARFVGTPEPSGIPLVVLPARMLRDKGVEEFVDAARQLKARGVIARFALVGGPDPENPASLPESTLSDWAREGVIEYWGWRDDMAEVFSACHVVCLPSYREGLPTALVEAAACGRAVVTCDVPGCREVVRHEDNGLLVPARDSRALAAAVACLLSDTELRARMGRRGRIRAVEEFSIERITADTLELYRSLPDS